MENDIITAIDEKYDTLFEGKFKGLGKIMGKYADDVIKSVKKSKKLKLPKKKVPKAKPSKLKKVAKTGGVAGAGGLTGYAGSKLMDMMFGEDDDSNTEDTMGASPNASKYVEDRPWPDDLIGHSVLTEIQRGIIDGIAYFLPPNEINDSTYSEILQAVLVDGSIGSTYDKTTEELIPEIELIRLRVNEASDHWDNVIRLGFEEALDQRVPVEMTPEEAIEIEEDKKEDVIETDVEQTDDTDEQD
jgi:hypothetical protein